MSDPRLDQVVRQSMRAWKPPPRLKLSEWADQHFYLSAESSAEPGRWRTLPYQRGIMDAITDPSVTQVTVQKSARVGFTKMLNAAIGYYMHQAPCPILLVQPTVEDAKGYSKEEIAPMLRDCPELARIVVEDAEEAGAKQSGNTILHKALALDTLVPTPSGWTTVEALQPGDMVFDESGAPTRVSSVTPVFRVRPCFRVRFSDGAEIVTDAEHGWAVEWWQVKKSDGTAKQTMRTGVLTTEQIAARVHTCGRNKYAVRNAGPLELPAAALPLDPYVLGVWLGDGLSHRSWVVSGHEDAAEMRELLAACGHRVDVRATGPSALLVIDRTNSTRGTDGRMQPASSGAVAALRSLGVLGTIGDSRKRIPSVYLRASKEQRIALLQGLMDTDGHARAQDGLCVLMTSVPSLAADYHDLLSGLGIKWTCKEVVPSYRHRGQKLTSKRRAFRFEFHAKFPAFRLRRKLQRQKPASLRASRRRIVAVEPVESVPVKCITVEGPSHLFLVGAQMIPTHNSFPGGVLSMIGANSGTGFRRISRKVVAFDEVDAYPPSAGSEGDQIRLGIKRSEYYWDRKILAGSTPLLAGSSRIEELFLAGDQRRYYVPCPHCGHMDVLVFREEAERGHFMKWPKDRPEDAFFVCRRGGCVIEHSSKRAMVTAGEWRPEAPFKGHASFHIWAAYSFSPNATWGQLATEFVEANEGGPQKLQTFVNTVLGETWTEKGDAPDWLRLYQRRESYPIGTVPSDVIVLTAGVDVQRDRVVWEVVGWGADKQSWSIDAGVLPGDTSSEDNDVWKTLDALLNQTWPAAGGSRMSLEMLAIDSGFNTNVVYSWARRYPRNRVMATKGVPTARVIVDAPSKVDVTVRGRKRRGYAVWPVGVNVAKSELYGWLRLEAPTQESGAGYPSGYCHFPQHSEEYFRQLTAEKLVRVVNKKTGFTTHEWQIQPGRENHWLDARVLARAAAYLAGLDRMAADGRARRAVPPRPAAESPQDVQPDQPSAHPPPPPAAQAPAPRPRGEGRWLDTGGRGSDRRGGSSWLKRRR